MTTPSKAALQAARKQSVLFQKTSAAAGASVAAAPNHLQGQFAIGATPVAGTIAGLALTAAGAVQVNTTTGYPAIESFGGATGYILGLQAIENGGAIANVLLYDRIYVAGSYNFNDNITLAAQPSIAARVPNGDYTQIGLWGEQATAPTGNQTVTVTYTNQDGVAGRTTGAVDWGASMAAGSMVQFPLQAGDSGVQMIESVLGAVASAGTFNLLLIRKLGWGQKLIPDTAVRVGYMKLGLPVVYEASCLALATGLGFNAVSVNVTIAAL